MDTTLQRLNSLSYALYELKLTYEDLLGDEIGLAYELNSLQTSVEMRIQNEECKRT